MRHYPLPETGYLRLAQIVGDKKAGIPPIIPVSKSTWWAGVKTCRYPQPVKLSERCTAWRVEDVRALIEKTSRGETGGNRPADACQVELVESVPPAVSFPPERKKSVSGAKDKSSATASPDSRQMRLV